MERQTNGTNTLCGKTKRHLMDISDKLSKASMVCTNRLNRCSTWFNTTRSSDKSSTIDSGDYPKVPMSPELIQGSGQSPSASYDDSVPPPKNCYRLVMLG